MRRFTVTYLLSLLLAPFVLAQQKSQAVNTPNQPAKPEQQGNQPKVDFLQEAAGSSIFIYNGDSKPCDARPLGTLLIPIGSGFVAGLQNKSLHPKPGEWLGMKLLITAEHVVHSRTSIVLRLNRAPDNSRFACFTIPLVREGESKNLFTLKGEEAADAAAVILPLMPDTDPTVFSPSTMLDRETMGKYKVKVGTNVFAVGYFYGYAGEKANYPITKFGKISLLSPEKWFLNPELDRYEQGYVVELQNVPGMSGAPVMTYGFEAEANPFRFRELFPWVIGTIKALERAPVPVGQQYEMISQGVAIVEPAANIRTLLSEVADSERKPGVDLDANW